jgi:hypothetical protein
MKAYAVWNEEAGEGVVFADRGDAEYAATGRSRSSGLSTVADEWRNIYGENGEQYDIQEIEYRVGGSP